MSRNTVFTVICGSGGSKSSLAKAVGAEPAGQMRGEKLHALVARSTFPRSDVVFVWQAQGIVHLVKCVQKPKGFVAFPKTLTDMGYLKRAWKDAFRMAEARRETCSSEMLGGQGADLLTWVAF